MTAKTVGEVKHVDWNANKLSDAEWLIEAILINIF